MATLSRFGMTASEIESVHRVMRQYRTGTCAQCGAKPSRTHMAYLRHPEPYSWDRNDYRELCSTCHAALDRELHRHKWERHAAQTHCLRGHELNEANTYIRGKGNGIRQCRPCHALLERERRLARG